MASPLLLRPSSPISLLLYSSFFSCYITYSEQAVSAEIVENGTTEAINDIKTSYQAMRVHLKEAKYYLFFPSIIPPILLPSATPIFTTSTLFLLASLCTHYMSRSELLAFRWRGFLLYEQALLQIHSAYPTFSLCSLLSRILFHIFSLFLYIFIDVVHILFSSSNSLHHRPRI